MTRVLVLIAALALPWTARAEPIRGSDLVPKSWGSVAWFLGGAAAAFVGHESCHVAMNLSLGVVPEIRPVTYLGFVPFFSISPTVTCGANGCVKDSGAPFGPGKGGLYAIVAAGMQCQQISNEIILSTDPQLVRHEAPFRKGMLAFNVLLSLGYAVSNWAGVEPRSGDVSSLDRLVRAPQGLIALSVFAPAVLDALRFFFPDAPGLPFVSWVAKGALVGFVFSI